MNKALVWPVAGGVLGVLVSMVHWEAGVTLGAGIAAWCAATLLVLTLSARPMGARIGVLLAGLFLAVPCFVRDNPPARALLMVFMTAPFAAAVALMLAPPLGNLRARVAYLFTYGDTHPVQRRPGGFDAGAFLQLAVATVVVAAGIATVKAASAYGLGLLVRWLGGVVAVLGFSQMATASVPFVATPLGLVVPPIFQSPYLSTSVSEFWARRWNLRASEFLFRACCFAPLARRSAALGLVAAFGLSAVGHACLAYMALGKWPISLCVGAFFAVQPLLIAAERWLGVRRWRPEARHAWTLTVMTAVSPLFIEPVLQMVEKDWGGLDQVLPDAAAVLGFALLLGGLVTLGSLAAQPVEQAVQDVPNTLHTHRQPS